MASCASYRTSHPAREKLAAFFPATLVSSPAGALTSEHVQRILRGQDYRGASVTVLCQLYQAETLFQGESPKPFRCRAPLRRRGTSTATATTLHGVQMAGGQCL